MGTSGLPGPVATQRGIRMFKRRFRETHQGPLAALFFAAVFLCAGAPLAGSAGGPAATPAAQRSAFTIGRLKYGGGGDWYGDQGSLRNLLAGLRDQIGRASCRERVCLVV